MLHSLLAILLLAIGAATVQGKDVPIRESEEALSWARSDDSLALMRDDQIVWRLNFDAKQNKVFFHPLNLPDAGTLTWDTPPDHPWHRGLWFSWKLINGVEYWEEDPETHKSDGLTTCDQVEIKQNADHSARIEMDLEYHQPGKPPVMVEHRVIEVSPPKENGSYRIDWTATFTAKAKKVLLDRTPPPQEPNGKPWGGYAGLVVRMAKEATHFEIVDSEQQVKKQEARMRFRARAVDYAGKIGKTTAGIAIFDHPKNLNAPTSWYVTRTHMTSFSPAVLQQAPHTFAVGETFTLRYRILVHPGRLDAKTLQKLSRRFADASNKNQGRR